MKSLVIIFSFLFITEIYQTQTSGTGNGKGSDALAGLNAIINERETLNGDKQTYQAISTTLSSEQTNQPMWKEKADTIRNTANKDKEAALNRLKLSYDKFKDKFQRALESSSKKQLEEMKLAELEHMKADIIATAIWRNTNQKWTNALENIEREYKETLSTANQKKAELKQARDTTLQSLDDQFVKTYTQVEEIRKKIESENKEVLATGQTEYENAVKLAETGKTQAEMEFQNAITNHDTVSLQQWGQIAAKYDTEIETYEKALQEADNEWQNVLDKVGIGKQYKEIVNQAVAQLVDAYRKIEQFVKTETEEYDEDLREVQKSRENVTKLASAGKEKANKELKEALDKAKSEAQKKYDAINKKTEKKKVSAMISAKKVSGEFQRMQDEILKKFDRAMKEASAVESGSSKLVEG